MLFSEVYGSYFAVVSEILTAAADGILTPQRMTELVREKAFAESALSIPAALKSGDWPLLRGDQPVLRHRPETPLTTLQKRWLKALVQDPRIRLFDPDITGLEEVEPLYAPGTFVYFDRYDDGDPYEDAAYIANFRTVLQALREKRKLRVRFRGHTGIRHSVDCVPYRLEYSAKDDKFRLLAVRRRVPYTVNLARLRSCELGEPYGADACREPRVETQELELLVHDERKALERVLLHFSHFEKETRRLEGDDYQMKLRYDREDETELLIRVLSFGPLVEVLAPASFRQQLRARLDRQRDLG